MRALDPRLFPPGLARSLFSLSLAVLSFTASTGAAPLRRARVRDAQLEARSQH
jgi:hypothetical protein